MDKAELVFTKIAERKKKIHLALKELIPGTLSGLIVAPLTHPLDTLQIKQQVGHGKTVGPASLKGFAKIEGLYKGLGMKMVKMVPQMALGYAIYGVSKKHIDKHYD